MKHTVYQSYMEKEMSTLHELLNTKRIPLNLHESLVVAYAITKNKIRFRFAVPCSINAIFADDCDENFYLIDFTANNPQLIDYELLFLDALLPEVISFEYINDEYHVIIEINGEDWNKIAFKAQDVEWAPIRQISTKELDHIKDSEIRYIQFP